FTELSVERLAPEAGISRATFYIYFEDKGRLLRRLATRIFDAFVDDAHRWWDVIERCNHRDLRDSVSRIIATYRRHQAVAAAVVEMAAYDPVVGDYYRHMLDDCVRGTADAIERGK